MTTPGSQTSQNPVDLFKNSHILLSHITLQEVRCMLQVDVIFRLFPGKTDIPCFTTVEKLWQIIDEVYFIPRAPVWKVKKAKAKKD